MDKLNLTRGQVETIRAEYARVNSGSAGANMSQDYLTMYDLLVKVAKEPVCVNNGVGVITHFYVHAETVMEIRALIGE